jgi:hypothetical protein
MYQEIDSSTEQQLDKIFGKPETNPAKKKAKVGGLDGKGLFGF